MPRVNERKAAKDYPQHGIKKGDTYYWWKFRYGGKHMSLKRPKGSQLTQRDDYCALRQAQEAADEITWEKDNREGLPDALSDVISLLESARDAAQEKYDNLPENFQNAEQGQNLEGFAAECDDAISELEDIKSNLEDEDTEWDEIESTPPGDISWPNEY